MLFKIHLSSLFATVKTRSACLAPPNCHMAITTCRIVIVLFSSVLYVRSIKEAYSCFVTVYCYPLYVI